LLLFVNGFSCPSTWVVVIESSEVKKGYWIQRCFIRILNP